MRFKGQTQHNISSRNRAVYLFLSSLWSITVAVVILFVSCLDPVVRKSDSDDGMGLQAFSHQNEWR